MESSIRKVATEGQFILNDVAFYGRTLSEYSQMFNFDSEQWKGKKVLDCAAGPASFTAEARRSGVKAVACDPLYFLPARVLVPRAEENIKELLAKDSHEWALFDPDACETDTHYASEKHRALFNFSQDYSEGKELGRYVQGALPDLPFENDSFDLVLSAHLLFVYSARTEGGVFESERFPLSFHIAAIREMLRVCKEEVRIYPLKGPNRPDNPLLSAVLAALSNDDVYFELVYVGYKDIAGADRMLRIIKNCFAP